VFGTILQEFAPPLRRVQQPVDANASPAFGRSTEKHPKGRVGQLDNSFPVGDQETFSGMLK